MGVVKGDAVGFEDGFEAAFAVVVIMGVFVLLDEFFELSAVIVAVVNGVMGFLGGADEEVFFLLGFLTDGVVAVVLLGDELTEGVIDACGGEAVKGVVNLNCALSEGVYEGFFEDSLSGRIDVLMVVADVGLVAEGVDDEDGISLAVVLGLGEAVFGGGFPTGGGCVGIDVGAVALDIIGIGLFVKESAVGVFDSLFNGAV